MKTSDPLGGDILRTQEQMTALKPAKVETMSPTSRRPAGATTSCYPLWGAHERI